MNVNNHITAQSELLFVCVTVTNVCLGFTQPNHNRKKQPSCQQKILF